MRITDKQGVSYEVRIAEFAPGQIAFHVEKDGIPIARAALNVRRQTVSDVVVYDPADRRKGIATALYDYIEREMGFTLMPNRMRLANGRDFWKAREKPQRRALGSMAPKYVRSTPKP